MQDTAATASARDGGATLEERLSTLLAARLPAFVRLSSVARLTGGASKAMHRVSIETDTGQQTLAMRRNWGSPDSAGTISTLLNEAALMQLAGAAGIPSPRIELIFRADDEDNPGLGDGFLMEWIEGETLGGRIARSPDLAEARETMAGQCGDILGRLQELDVEGSGLAARLHRYTAAEAVEQTYEGYLSLGMPVPTIDYAAAWLRSHLPPKVDAKLVHGDFRSGNLMVDRTGVVAVLDWENAGLGDPLRDLAWICVNSWRYGVSEKPVGGFGELEDLIGAYEARTGTVVDRDCFHFWQVFGSFWWACTTLRLADSYRQGVVTTADRVVIGRRCSEAEIDLVNLLVPGSLDPPPAPAPLSSELASLPELVESVRNCLESDFLPHSSGREKFLVRVVLQSLGIVQRDLELGQAARGGERRRLLDLLGAEHSEGDLQALRARLCQRLRAGDMELDDPTLKSHLRQTVVARILIDQPRYSGLREAQKAAKQERKHT